MTHFFNVDEAIYKKKTTSSPLSLLYMNTEPFVVGFADTMYTVSEGDGQVEVCVTLISPEGDIGGEVVLVEVFSNSGSILTGVTAASKMNFFVGSHILFM